MLGCFLYKSATLIVIINHNHIEGTSPAHFRSPDSMNHRGGVVIDWDLKSTLDGLYAAGETIGNLHGDRYIGGGGSFGPCIVFGKLAGENAARYARALND